MKIQRERERESKKDEYQERELGPEIDEISVCKDRVGFAKFFINEAHDKG